jgi:hypothetical protein
LDIAIAAFVAIDEILQEERNIALLQIAALAQIVGDIGGNVLRPFRGGEGDDADRVFILAGQQVENDGIELGRAGVGLAPDRAQPPEMPSQFRWGQVRPPDLPKAPPRSLNAVVDLFRAGGDGLLARAKFWRPLDSSARGIDDPPPPAGSTSSTP